MTLHKADCFFASEINRQEEKIMCLKVMIAEEEAHLESLKNVHRRYHTHNNIPFSGICENLETPKKSVCSLQCEIDKNHRELKLLIDMLESNGIIANTDHNFIIRQNILKGLKIAHGLHHNYNGNIICDNTGHMKYCGLWNQEK